MKTNKIFMNILGAMIIIGFFLLLGLLVFQPMPPENKSLLEIAIGCLLTAFGTVVGYYYGSSKGSADKTEFMVKTNGEVKP